jgi:hypothetical protein
MAPRRRRPGPDLLAILDAVQPSRLDAQLPPEQERLVWGGLWFGTMRLLALQEPRAFARVMAKLERHGLVGRRPGLQSLLQRTLTFAVAGGPGPERHGLVGRRPGLHFPEGERPGLREPEGAVKATDAFRFVTGDGDKTLAQVAAYMEDGSAISLRGRGRHLAPAMARGHLLVMAYYGTRWKLTHDPPPGPRLRGDALEDRAVARVAARYGLTPASAQTMIKRARAALPRETWQWFQDEGAYFWKATMMGPVRDRGVLKT